MPGNIAGERFRISPRFPEDAGGPNHGVLRVRTGFSFKAEGVLEIEGDQRLFRVLEHEVAQGADRDLRCNPQAFRLVNFRVASIHFFFSGRDELIEQIVRFYAEPPAAAYPD